MVQSALGKCPVCRKAAVEAAKPFCSSRCAMVDLGQWLGEGYRVPMAENDEESGLFTPTSGDEDEGL